MPQEHKEAVLKEFENHFHIADGILELWEQVLPDGDWDAKTASMNDLKFFLSQVLDEAYKAGEERMVGKIRDVVSDELKCLCDGNGFCKCEIRK